MKNERMRWALCVALVMGSIVAFAAAYGYTLVHIDEAWSWGNVKAWLYRHDRSFDEITVWAIALGWTIWSLSKVPPLFALWGAKDRTAIGRTMRPQKASEMVAGLSIASLYWLTLIAYYAEWMPTFWTRL